MKRLQGLAAVVNADTRLIVLGSFPGVASLKAQQYYGHPHNQFWKILGALWALPLSKVPYAQRIELTLAQGVGLWDVYGACERQGSLDSAIRQGELNDFAWLQTQCTQLQAIAHNGSKSFKHIQHTKQLDLPVYKLPSTSPANASWSFENKLAAWRTVFEEQGIA